MKIRANKAIDYLLMFYLLALSGNPYFTQNIEKFTLFTIIFSLPTLFKYKKYLLNKVFVFIILFFIGFEILHSFLFELDYSRTIIKILLLYLFVYAIILRLRRRFVEIFVNTLVGISLISFVFFIFSMIPGINHILYDFADRLFPLKNYLGNFRTPTLIIFTLDPGYFTGSHLFPRNAGIFWEAGGFGAFLCLGYFLHLVQTKPVKIIDLFNRKAIILILAIVTTTSTATYLTLGFILIIFSFYMKGVYKIVLLIILIIGFNIAFNRLDFLRKKLTDQISEAKETNNRFGSALLDWQDIKQRPLTGWSRRISVLFGEDVASSHRPNGITNVIRNYGFIYFGIYLILLYKTFRNIAILNRINLKYAIAGVFIVLLVSFSQALFDYPFFRGFILLAVTYGLCIKSDKYFSSIKMDPLEKR